MPWTGGGAMNYQLQPKFEKAKDQSTLYNFMAQAAIGKGYNKAGKQWRPWAQSGEDWLDEFNAWSADPNAITNDPSYQWRLNQGIGALENSAAARGGLLSGNTATAITDYAQNAASQEYANEFARWMNKLGLGMNAVGNLAGIQTGKANALASLLAQLSGQSWNQTMDAAREIRAAENDFNNVLQSWMPSTMGGGSPGQASEYGGGTGSNTMNYGTSNPDYSMFSDAWGGGGM